jgi:hypothetical protein
MSEQAAETTLGMAQASTMLSSPQPVEAEHHSLDEDGVLPALLENAPLLPSPPPHSQDADHLNQTKPVAGFWLGFSPNLKYCIALELLCEFSTMILTVPMVSLLEQAICQRYYHNAHWTGSLDSDICGVPQIQRTLAQVRGWKAFFDTLSGMIPQQEVNCKA